MNTIRIRDCAVRRVEKLVKEREEILNREPLEGDGLRLDLIIHELAANLVIACKDYWERQEREGER